MPILTLSILCTHCTHSSIFPVSSPAISRWCRWPLHPKLVSKERQVGLSVRCIQIGFHIIDEPDLVHLAQVNVGRVLEDEAADILLMDQVAVAVLLRASCRASEFGLQMAAPDPARHGVRVDPQCLRKTVGGVEAAVMLETHPLQLRWIPVTVREYPAAFSFRRIRSSLIHAYRDRIPSSASLHGSSLVRANPNSRARFFKAQCGIPTLLANGRIPKRVFPSRWLR